MSEKVISLLWTTLLLMLFFAGAPAIASSQDRGAPRKGAV